LVKGDAVTFVNCAFPFFYGMPMFASRGAFSRVARRNFSATLLSFLRDRDGAARKITPEFFPIHDAPQNRAM
jgi:hypothetical protein